MPLNYKIYNNTNNNFNDNINFTLDNDREIIDAKIICIKSV